MYDVVMSEIVDVDDFVLWLLCFGVWFNMIVMKYWI